MSESLHIATQHFLQSNGLSQTDLVSLLDRLSGPAIDAGDVYFQHCYHESFVLEDGILKDGSYNIDQGVGIRAISGEKTGFAYSNDIVLPRLLEAATAARSISGHVHQIGQMPRQPLHSIQVPVLYTHQNPLNSLAHAEKMMLLQSCDAIARKNPFVTQVIASLNGVYEIVLVAALDGTFQADIRPLVRLNVTVILDKEGKRESASAGGGGRFEYKRFIEGGSAQKYAEEAVRRALINLEARPAPAGPMPVVLGPGWPGVLLHEAVGHGLEGDFNRKGSSTFSGRIGEQVASTACTVVDDGTLADRRGSLTLDDEGTPTQHTVLIENGILKGYLQDKFNARLMGTHSTGNGRRESYAALPLPRMTNTFMLRGPYAPEEIISTVENGIYAVNFGGGSVDITSGKFVFSASEAYRIEKGRITYPIKGATLIGVGPEVMNRISMVGNDLALDSGVGSCGKEGQTVPVGVGQPTLLVDEIIVGGTES
jgi:TldD protein